MKLIAVVFLLVGMASYCAFGSPPDSLSAAKASAPQTSKDSLAKQPPVKQAPAVQSTPAKKPSIDEEDLLIEESDVKKNAAREAAIKDSLAKIQAANSVHADSIAKAASVSDSGHGPGQAVGAVNSEQPGVKKDSASAAVEAPAAAEKPKEVVPVTIESVHSINFAKNLKDYRSPKKAMFLSLIVPGLGQAYTKHYVRAGIFVAIEAAAIGGAIFYNAKGKNEYNAAKNFADQNYSSDNFTAYYGQLQQYFSTQLGGDSAAQSELNSIFFDSLPAIQASAASKSPAFYSSLEGASNVYVQGWNDCEPKYSSTNPVGGPTPPPGKIFTYQTHPDTTESGAVLILFSRPSRILHGNTVIESGIFGYSPNQIAYTNMMSKSNDYYKLANTILALMIINHVASAIDALFGAYAYNNQLLGRETLWQHVKVSPQFAMDLVNPSLGLALKVGF